MSLPPGFRFHPTDDELVSYYLKRKVDGLKIELDVIPVINLYKFDPWELPGIPVLLLFDVSDKSFLPVRDMEWFFFCPRDKKYMTGLRTNRATQAGYWKATGKDRKIICHPDLIGFRKTLVFYRGRAPSGDRTAWIMHEYRLCAKSSQESSGCQGDFTLCRVMKRNNPVKKFASPQGVSKKDISSSMDGITQKFAEVPRLSKGNTDLATTVLNGSNESMPLTSSSEVSDGIELQPTAKEIDQEFCSTGPSKISECVPWIEFPSSSTEFELNDPILSPNSCHFIEEVDLAEALSRDSCMSPSPRALTCMGIHIQALLFSLVNTISEVLESSLISSKNKTQVCNIGGKWGDGDPAELSNLLLQELSNLLLRDGNTAIEI
ncbi:hypothetical protein ACLOJK_028465 [Asimina triloba]